MPVGISKVDDFIVFQKRVIELNESIDDYKPASDFITALKMIIDDYKIKLPSHYR
jgi:hypothetical protein